jgi:hypothetical protein
LQFQSIGLVGQYNVLDVPLSSKGSIINAVFHVELAVDVEQEVWMILHLAAG